MAEQVRDVMTEALKTVTAEDSAEQAAQQMRDQDIGAIVVTGEGDDVRGIVTDRDIVVRAVAEGKNPAECRVEDVLSGELVTISPEQPVEEAVNQMREANVRRLPVVEDGRAIGILAIGDLAVERDEESALADISAAAPNR